MGIGIPQTTDDFGRMWKREKVERTRALKVLPRIPHSKFKLKVSIQVPPTQIPSGSP